MVFTVGEPTYNWHGLYQVALQSGPFNITDNSPPSELVLTIGTTQLVVQGIGLRADSSRHLSAGSIADLLTELDKPAPDSLVVNQAAANLLLLEPFNVTNSNDRDCFGASLTGGTGGDFFDFDFITETAETVAARDVITDFSQRVGNRDQIDLFDIDANTTLGNDQAFSFVAATGGAFAGAGSLPWSQANPACTVNNKTIIMGDVNGDGVADFHIELIGLVNLTAADFIL